jgi:hypothetical protein
MKSLKFTSLLVPETAKNIFNNIRKSTHIIKDKYHWRRSYFPKKKHSESLMNVIKRILFFLLLFNLILTFNND